MDHYTFLQSHEDKSLVHSLNIDNYHSNLKFVKYEV